MSYTKNSDLLQITVGETSSSGWNYQYDPVGHPNNFIRSVYYEQYGVATNNWGSVKLSSSFTVDTAFGSQAAPDTATLHYGDLKLTRKVIPPEGRARQFSIQYVLTNTSQATSLQNVRFFQGIDYDIYGSDYDYGWYADTTDIVWQNDDSYFRNGFGGSRRSSHHECNYYGTMWSHMGSGTLNDANKFPETGTADVGVALQWDAGNLATGASWDLTITFYFGEAAGIQANAGPDQSVGRAAPVTFDGSRSESVDTIVKYEWDANNDGTYEINAGNSPTYSFAGWNALGQYTVRLRVTDDHSRVAEDTVIYTVMPNVDLTITSFIFSPADNISDGDTVTFTAVVKNQGTDDLTGNFYVRLDIDNNYVARRQVSGLTAGSSTGVELTWTATSGNHTAKAIADEYAAVVETSETNNEATRNLPAIPTPDLTVLDLARSPSDNISDGDTVTFTAAVKNNGTGKTSRDFYVRFEIDNNYIGRQVIHGLNAGATAQVTQTWAAVSGNHTAKAIADENNVVPESSETNNEASVNLPAIPFPDLTVSALTWFPASGIVDGDDVVFTATVPNLGPGATSRGFYVQFKIDGNPIGSQSVPSGVPAGGSVQVYQHWAAQAGSHTVSAIADEGNRVAEANETNNTFSPSPNLPNIPQPDLKVTALTWQPATSIIDGQTVTFTATVENSGSSNTTRDFRVRFEIDSVSVGSQSVIGGLSTGSTVQVTQNWKARSGTHTVRAVADSDNVVSESNETNNTYTPSPNLPSIPQPDLQVAELTFAPATGIGHGQTVTFTARITNAGAGATAANFPVHFQIDGNYIGYRTMQNGLPAGGSANVTQTWIAVSGNHTAKAIADPYDYVGESNETNNERQVSLPSIPSPPQVTVTSPNGGETWVSVQNVTWTATSPDSLPLTIDIELYNGYSYKAITTGLANSGSFQWNTTKYADASAVPDGTYYKVRVTATDTRSVKGNDLSNNWFTVWNTPQVELTHPFNLTTTEQVNANYTLTITNRQPQADTFNLSVINSDNAAAVRLSQNTISLNAWATSTTVSLNVTDETAGVYNVTVKAQSQANASISAERQIQTRVLSSFGLGLVPGTGQTSIGGSLGYDLVITNNQRVTDTFNLSLSGINASWYTLPGSATLNAGETRRIPLVVTVSDNGSAGTYNLQAQATSTSLGTSKQASAVLGVSAGPLIFNLQPPNNTRSGATEVLVTWQTSVSASSQVFVKAQTTTNYTEVTGTAGINHLVPLSGISRNTAYDYYVRSQGTHGVAESEVRRFYVDNGITFGQRSYSFTIERNYGQAVNISVTNTDNEPHDLLLSVRDVPQELVVGFVGEGSQDLKVPLHPGESKSVALMLHAQDAQHEDYKMVLGLTSVGAEAISDSAMLNIRVHIPNINFALVEVSADPSTLVRTLSVTNNGDPLTDLRVSMSSELTSFLTFNPSVNHLYLGTGQTVKFQAVPILSPGYTGASGNVTARAAGQERSLTLDFRLPQGKQVYVGHAPNMTIAYDPQFDNDALANTNPNGNAINSYLFQSENKSGAAFIAQVMVKVLHGGEPAYHADVLLQVTSVGVPATYAGVTDVWGRCVFTIAGPPGEYSYFARVKGYPASTPVRTFTVTAAPTLTMRPLSISWLSATDAGQTQDISSNATGEVTLGAPPFTIKASMANIPEGAVPVLFLTNDAGYSDGEIIGEVQGDNLVFNVGSEVDPGTYRATIGLQAPGLIATSKSRNFIFSDTDAAPGDNWKYHYQMPFPVNATSVGVLDIQNEVVVANPHKLVRQVWLEPQDASNSTYVFTYMIVADRTMDDTLIVKVTDNNSNILYQNTQPIHLVEYEATFVDVPVPVRNAAGQRIENFSIDVTTLDYSRFTNFVKSWTTDPGGVFDGETWSIFWNNGVLTPQNRAGVIFKCIGGFLPGLGTAITAIDTVNQATTGDWVAAGGGMGQLATDPLEKLGTLNYEKAGKHVWDLIKNADPEVADAILKNTKGNMQKLIKGASRVKNLASIARFAGYAAGVKSNYDDWKRVTEEQEPSKAKAETSQKMSDWYCTNRPVIGVDFGLPSYIPQYVTASPPTPNVDEATLTMRFSPGFASGAYKDVLPHDMHILLNGTEIGTLTNVVPNGHYTFSFNPALLNYAQQGTARNTLTVSTQHMNSGHYVVSSDFSVMLGVKRVDMTGVASSQNEADQLVTQMAGTVVPKADYGVYPENFSFSVRQPTDGERVRIETTVYNLGSVDLPGIPIQFSDNATEIERWDIPYIPAHGQVKVATWWTAALGSHNIAVKVNGNRSIAESNYSNNEASVSVQVAAPDRTPPTITNPQPANQSTVTTNTPLITADLADVGAGINTAAVTITMDTTNVTASATVTPTRVSYRPATALSEGAHQVVVQAKDMKGNPASLTWQFTIHTEVPLTVITDNATGITANSAILNGTLTSKVTADNVTLSFQWGLSENYTGATTSISANTTGAFSSTLSGLSSNTTYHFRAKAVGNGTSYGGDKTFTTVVPVLPTVTTDNATGVTANSAILNGTLNNLGNAPAVALSFQWGLSENYTGETTPTFANTTRAFSSTLSGLSSNTTYHFRAKAVGNGTSYGVDKTFTTVVLVLPTVTTDNATGVTANSGTLNGTLTSKGSAYSVALSFEWGLAADNYTGNTPPVSTNATGPFSFALSGLSPSTTYHFRARAAGNGTSYGLDKTFTTAAGIPPTVTTDIATGIAANSATLNGTLTSKGSAYSVALSFEWGLAADNYTGTTPPVSTNATGPFSFALSGLAPGTTYHFRARAAGDGTSYGADMAFTTTGDAPIFLDPPAATTGIGQVFNLAIKTNVATSQAVSGVQAFINYDPSYLTVVDADNTTPEVEITPGIGLPMLLVNSVNISAGTIDFAAGKLTTPFPTGTFTVATIQLRALAATDNGTTAVTFSFTGTRTTIVDYGGSALPGTHGDAAVQITSGAAVDISVVLQGGSRPDAGWVIPVTVKFFTPGANVLSATPLYTRSLTTTKSGSTAICQATSIQSANYDITIVSEHTLLNVKRSVAVAMPSTAVNMGTLLEGDANNDYIVNISDFGILAVAFMKTTGQPGFDARADFDRNGIINISDFGLLAVNFMRTSPVAVP